MKYDIHNYEKQLKCAENALKKAKISSRNKELIFEFQESLNLENLSKPRIIKYLDTLKRVAELIGKDLDKAEKKDIERFVGIIQQRDYSEWTKQCYKVMVRRFYRWLRKTGEEYPDEVKWIKIHFPKNKKTLPKESELLKEKDIKKLMECVDSIRDKALIAVLWESGCRIGEIGNLSLNSVSFDKYGAVMDVKGKTGQRRIRVINATSYLANWVSIHPLKDSKEAPLWVTIKNTHLGYGRISRILRELFEKAGIKKRFHPHIFRHSRATFLANHLTEFQMNQYFGWVQGSDMPSTYVHLSGKNTDEALLKLNGIEIKGSREKQEIKPKLCIRCDTINSDEAKFCCKCGAVLDIKAVMEIENQTKQREKIDSLMNQLVKDPAVMQMLAEKIKEIAG